MQSWVDIVYVFQQFNSSHQRAFNVVVTGKEKEKKGYITCNNKVITKE